MTDMTKKKVVHLSTVHRVDDIRAFQKELRTLATAGYEAVYIVPHIYDEVRQGVQIRAVQRSRTRLGRVTRTAWQVMRRALAEDADIYHIQHVPELLFYTLWLRIQGKTVIYDMHENVPKALLSKLWLPPLLRLLVGKGYRLIERLLLGTMPIIFAETSYAKDYPWLKKNTAIVLNMPIVDELLNIKIMRQSTPTIGYIGGVNEQRGSLTILNALNILKTRGITVAWECVGPATPTHANTLRQFVDTHQLDSIQFHGYLPSQEGYKIISGCHVGLAVLEAIPNYIESFPTKMFEYMALQQPVIVSGFPLYRAIIDKYQCGLCINDPKDAQEVADAIQWIIEHPDEGQAMGRRGYTAVINHYRWDIEAEKLLDFYDQLITNRV